MTMVNSIILLQVSLGGYLHLSLDPLSTHNVQNDLLLDGTLTVCNALEKAGDLGEMFVWSQAILASGMKSNATLLAFKIDVKL